MQSDADAWHYSTPTGSSSTSSSLNPNFWDALVENDLSDTSNNNATISHRTVIDYNTDFSFTSDGKSTIQDSDEFSGPTVADQTSIQSGTSTVGSA